MPSGIEGHRVEASENNVDDNVWTKMKQNDSEFKYNRWVDGTIGIKLWETKFEGNKFEKFSKLMQNMRLSPSGKASSAIDICCSFSIWLRRQPTNQPGPELIFAQNFYRISPTSCIPPNHNWFSTITRLVSHSCKFNKSTWKLLFTSLPPKPAKTKFIGPRSPIIIVHSLTN